MIKLIILIVIAGYLLTHFQQFDTIHDGLYTLFTAISDFFANLADTVSQSDEEADS